MRKSWCKKMGWMQITLILCMFGLLKEFRPNEPFVTDYLTGPWKDFTVDQVTKDIYPISIYSYMATLVLVFLLTDLLRYKPVIILCGLSGTTTFLIMMLANSMPWMQVMEFTYGLFMSTEVAYFTYIYAKVDKEHYQAVSSYTRSSYLVGKFLSGVISQIATSFDFLDYHQLIYLTVAGIGLATIWSFFLPPVNRSIYFHRTSDIDDSNGQQLRNDKKTSSLENLDAQSTNSRQSCETDVSREISRLSLSAKLRRAYVFLWQDFLRAYTNRHVVKWSLWWAFATCGYAQVNSYSQALWQTAVAKDAKIYNGAVEALYTIIGALAVVGVGRLRLNWSVIGEAALSIFSIVEAALLVVSFQCYNIWILYAVYILFGVIYHTMITVASFEVAKHLSDDSYGLVFGLNTLLALTLQSVLTFIVVSGNVLVIGIRPQFQIYAGYFMVLGVVFMLMATYTIVRFLRSGRLFRLWINEESPKDAAQRETVGISAGTENPS